MNRNRLSATLRSQRPWPSAMTKVGDLSGVRGAPGILERAEPLDTRLARTALFVVLGAVPFSFAFIVAKGRPRARTGHIADFRPTRHHRGAAEIVELVDGALVRWGYPAMVRP